MFPFLFHFGGFKVASYGVLVAAAYLTAILWLKGQIRNMRMTENEFWTMIYCLFFGAIAGGKLLFVLLEWRRFWSGEMSLIRDFRYGFVFFGGFVGATLMGLLYARYAKRSFLEGGDYFAVALPLGHAVGRLGCLAAGCCYGRPTTLPWGVRFSNPGSLVDASLLGVPLHPTQLYESAANLLIACAMYRVLADTRRGNIRAGTAFLGYIILYAVARFAIEFYRGDDRGGFWLGLSPSQCIALVAFVTAGFLLWRNGIKTKSSRQ